MSVREDLLQDFRSWIKTQLSITDKQVILVQRGEKGPRPPLPYLTVNLTTFDLPVGTEETEHRDEELAIRGDRQATLEIRGYGDGSDEWLTELGFRVDTYEGKATIVTQSAGIGDASRLVSESIESQYFKEFLIEYQITGTEAAPTADQSTITVGDTDETITHTFVVTWS